MHYRLLLCIFRMSRPLGQLLSYILKHLNAFIMIYKYAEGISEYIHRVFV